MLNGEAVPIEPRNDQALVAAEVDARRIGGRGPDDREIIGALQHGLEAGRGLVEVERVGRGDEQALRVWGEVVDRAGRAGDDFETRGCAGNGIRGHQAMHALDHGGVEDAVLARKGAHAAGTGTVALVKHRGGRREIEAHEAVGAAGPEPAIVIDDEPIGRVARESMGFVQPGERRAIGRDEGEPCRASEGRDASVGERGQSERAQREQRGGRGAGPFRGDPPIGAQRDEVGG